jgi:hypothetical protein
MQIIPNYTFLCLGLFRQWPNILHQLRILLWVLILGQWYTGQIDVVATAQTSDFKAWILAAPG